ncbi:MAG TPA: lipid-A-disaccharide synthase [Vicinamibacterales bacterium]
MRIMISCGEASGDLYAGALAAELHARAPSVEIVGFGGQRLQAAGATLAGDFTGLTVTGLTEIVRVLPQSWRMYRRLVNDARTRRPDVFVAIDFSGFNFHLIAALRRLGIAIVYYVSPQLWAWRPRRIETMKRFVDKVLVIFPFEAGVYERAGVPVQFVGHPLVDLARAVQPRSAFLSDLGLRPDAPTVALLPGSRPNELRRIAPDMAAAIPLIRARLPGVQFVVARAPNLGDELFSPFPSDVVVVDNRTDDVLAASDVVVTASGTATVQAALHEKPMVVVYRLSPLTYRLGKPFVRVDMYAMVNLVAGRRVVPELIQTDFTPERVAQETILLLTDTERHARTRDALRAVCERLGPPGASGRAADAILDVARRAPRGVSSA